MSQEGTEVFNKVRKIKNRLNRWIYKNKLKDKVIIGKKVTIDHLSRFEGFNRLAMRCEMYNSFLGYGSYVGAETKLENVRVGRYTCIGPRVRIIIGEHPLEFVSMHPAFYSTREQAGFSFVKEQKFEEFRYADEGEKVSVIIGNDVWIAADCRILEGVTIGDGAAILAGAVVTKDVPPYAIVGGVPAKIIKYRFPDEKIQELLKIKWWEWEVDDIRNKASLFTNVDVFADKFSNI